MSKEELTAQEIEAREDRWWEWHDSRDPDPEVSRISESLEEAEARARAWALGESDDGPEH